MDDKVVKIKYLDGWKIHDDGVKTPEYGYKSISKSHYKRYYNTLCLVAGVGGAARNVLDYFCERMDGNNIIHSNQAMREKFREDIDEWTNGETTYTDSAVKKGIHTLVKKGLLLKTKNRGTLEVNPEYFFKGDERFRAHKIQMILEFKEDHYGL